MKLNSFVKKMREYGKGVICFNHVGYIERLEMGRLITVRKRLLASVNLLKDKKAPSGFGNFQC